MRALVMLIVLSCLGACGSMRPTEPPQALHCDLERFTVSDVYSKESVLFSLQSMGQAAKPASFNVLALSAGGEFGAYGSGFLAGWDSVGPAALPSARRDIQVVTGVSTGALMATHTFLGGMDEFMVEQYSHLAGSDVYRKRSVLELIRANSLYDTTKKDELIARLITGDLIDKVAAESARGLYLGFVNADTGAFVRIDMVALAKGDQTGASKNKTERNACYQAVVGASSAIPVAFSPKFIDDQMLIDGGARSFLFLTEVPPASAVAGMTRRLFSFVHGSLSISCPEKVGNGVLAIAERTSSIAGDQNFKGSIRLLEDLAQRPISPSDSSPTFSTYYAAAASAAAFCEPVRQTCMQDGAGGDLFCPSYESCLATRGRSDGVAATTSGAAGGTSHWLRFEDLKLGSQNSCVANAVNGSGPTRAMKRVFQ
jgi:Patatin-like phospholipase